MVDYALSRPEVDHERLAVYGMSGGGGFVPQAAMHDPRLKAIVMNACVVDARPLFATMPVVQATPQEIDVLVVLSRQHRQNYLLALGGAHG